MLKVYLMKLQSLQLLLRLSLMDWWPPQFPRFFPHKHTIHHSHTSVASTRRINELWITDEYGWCSSSSCSATSNCLRSRQINNHHWDTRLLFYLHSTSALPAAWRLHHRTRFWSSWNQTTTPPHHHHAAAAAASAWPFYCSLIWSLVKYFELQPNSHFYFIATRTAAPSRSPPVLRVYFSSRDISTWRSGEPVGATWGQQEEVRSLVLRKHTHTVGMLS